MDGGEILMKLVVLGDLHYPEVEEDIFSLRKARDNFFKRFLAAFLNIEADAHISIGDLTNFGKISEYQQVLEILSRKNRNFYHV